MTTIAHVIQVNFYHKPYTWLIAMGSVWKLLCYMVRIKSIQSPDSLTDATWFILTLMAPLWVHAFVYMILGRMVWNFTSEAKVYGVPAWRLGSWFISTDIIAFIIQVYGSVTAVAKPDQSHPLILQGLHIYMGGVVLQQIILFVCIFFTIEFHQTLLRENILSTQTKGQVLTNLYTIYIVLFLVTFPVILPKQLNILFNLARYSSGRTDLFSNQEAFQYSLDSLPILIVFILLNFTHPAQVMSGTQFDLPSSEERKSRGITQEKGAGS